MGLLHENKRTCSSIFHTILSKIKNLWIWYKHIAFVLSRQEKLLGKWVLGPAFLFTYFWIVIQPSPATSHKCVLLCSDTNLLNSGKCCHHNFFLFNRLKTYLTEGCEFKFICACACWTPKCSVKGQDCRVAVPVLCWWFTCMGKS